LLKPIGERFKQNSIYRFLNDVPEDRPTLEVLSDAIEDPMQLLGELEEIRKHLLRSVIALAITTGISFYFAKDLLNFLATPIGGLSELYALQLTDPIGVFMTVSFVTGVALAIPYIAFEIWLFAAPGLMPPARKIGLGAIPLALIFFLSGVAFTYFVMLTPAVEFLRGFLDIKNNTSAVSYISLTLSLMFWVGVSFEFPLVIWALSAMGLVQPRMLLQHWRIAIIIIAVVAAMITPTVDPVNMGLVMAPMIVLYFLSILFSYMARPRKTV
jgi:sec-independent protein translocase protein TatC